MNKFSEYMGYKKNNNDNDDDDEDEQYKKIFKD